MKGGNMTECTIPNENILSFIDFLEEGDNYISMHFTIHFNTGIPIYYFGSYFTLKEGTIFSKFIGPGKKKNFRGYEKLRTKIEKEIMKSEFEFITFFPGSEFKKWEGRISSIKPAISHG